ncbi:type II secretion system protein [Planctomycetota bacterium]
MQIRKCFTLIEVLVVILIVAILASVAVPIVRGKVNDAKWSEAKAAAGTIRTAVATYAVVKSVALVGELVGNLAEKSRRELLGFQEGDLTGSYFVPGDYNIDAVNERGNASITITASTPKGPPVGESKTLMFDGTWDQ